MTVFDETLLCAGEQQVQIFEKHGKEEVKVYDGPWSKVPGSLEDSIIEEISTKYSKLQLYIL